MMSKARNVLNLNDVSFARGYLARVAFSFLFCCVNYFEDTASNAGTHS